MGRSSSVAPGHDRHRCRSRRGRGYRRRQSWRPHSRTGKDRSRLGSSSFYGSSLAAIGRGNLSHSRRIDQEVLEVDVASAPQDSSPRAEEASLVSNWRRERLVAAGVSEPSAELLSMDHRFSVHELEQLLAAGCPLETALRILEPI